MNPEVLTVTHNAGVTVGILVPHCRKVLERFVLAKGKLVHFKIELCCKRFSNEEGCALRMVVKMSALIRFLHNLCSLTEFKIIILYVFYSLCENEMAHMIIIICETLGIFISLIWVLTCVCNSMISDMNRLTIVYIKSI